MWTPLLLLEEVMEEDSGVEGSFQLPPKLSVSVKKNTARKFQDNKKESEHHKKHHESYYTHTCIPKIRLSRRPNNGKTKLFIEIIFRHNSLSKTEIFPSQAPNHKIKF